MIKSCDGNILTSAGTINSEMTINYLEKTKLYSEISDFVDYQNGHINCSFRNIMIDNHVYNITLYFRDKKLISVSLGCLLSIENEITWSIWSLEREQERRKLHNKLLEKWLGKGEEKSNYLTYEFDWGIVSSSYDQKSGSSNISINYR